MTTFLPSCARLHPGIASAIILSRPHYLGRRARVQRNCSECQRARRNLRKVPATFVAVPVPLPDYGLALGVMRLSWTPPEFTT